MEHIFESNITQNIGHYYVTACSIKYYITKYVEEMRTTKFVDIMMIGNYKYTLTLSQ